MGAGGEADGAGVVRERGRLWREIRDLVREGQGATEDTHHCCNVGEFRHRSVLWVFIGEIDWFMSG